MTAVSSFATHVTAPVNFVLMRGLLRAARRVMPYFNGTMPGTLEMHGGSASVKWRRIENLATATTALGEVTGNAAFGMSRTAVTPTITDLTVAIAKYGNYFNVSEELDLFNVNSRAAQLLDNLGENAGATLNELMRDVMDGETTGRFGGGVSATTSIVTSISLNDIKYTVNLLNRNSAMKFFTNATGSQNVTSSTVRSSYFGACHSDVEEDIRGLSGFIGVEQYAGYTDTFVSEFGAVGGVRWSSTETAPIVSAAGTTSIDGFRGGSATTNNVYATFIYGRESVGSVGLGEDHVEEIYSGGDSLPSVELIQKPLGSAGAGDPFNEVATLAWKAWFAGKVLNSAWMKKVETLATDLS